MFGCRSLLFVLGWAAACYQVEYSLFPIEGFIEQQFQNFFTTMTLKFTYYQEVDHFSILMLLPSS